jgi:hypothetical protein
LPSHPSESLIASLWQNQLSTRTDLATEEGEPIRVIYPGRINRDRGADLLDAVIDTGQGLKKGDIELHVKSSGWRAHRHHLDHAYNRVILHVVMWRDTGVTTRRQNGEPTSILELQSYLHPLTSQWPDPGHPPEALGLPCRQAGRYLPKNVITGLLDRAGEARFLSKTAAFRTELTGTQAGQVLYEGIMVALGYVQNKLPFQELARRVPLHVLESLTRNEIPAEDCLARPQALLMGTAGLLPSQRPENYSGICFTDGWKEKLERLWYSCRREEVMPVDSWRLSLGRPNNSPLRRLAAMSHLILRYREKGILAALLDRVEEAATCRGHHALEEALQVVSSDYWADHTDFGLRNRQLVPALLGRSRAADIAVNVLLPFVFAWSHYSRPELSRQTYDLYRHYPRLAANNLDRHMSRQLGLTTDLVSSALRQQGLLHPALWVPRRLAELIGLAAGFYRS